MRNWQGLGNDWERSTLDSLECIAKGQQISPVVSLFVKLDNNIYIYIYIYITAHEQDNQIKWFLGDR